MKIFIDSADLDEIKQAFEWGIADGVTTNPSLIKKAVDKLKAKGQDVNLESYIQQILQVAYDKPVSLEVTEITAKGMIQEAEKLYGMFRNRDNTHIKGNINIKVPINPASGDEDENHFVGIEVIKTLTARNIPTNCTLIFTPEQALLAAKAGATYVSPFAGRVDDDLRKGGEFNKKAYYPAEGLGKNDDGIVSGVDLVKQCVQILKQYNLKTEVLAASLRNVRQVREVALVGSQIATLPFGVIQDMLKHHKTYEGMQKFTQDVVPEYKDLIRKKPNQT